MKATRIEPGLYRTDTGWTLKRSTLVGALRGGTETIWLAYPTDGVVSPDTRLGLSSLPGFGRFDTLADARAYAEQQGGAP